MIYIYINMCVYIRNEPPTLGCSCMHRARSVMRRHGASKPGKLLLAARRSCAQRNVSPKYSPVPDRWSMKPQVSNRSLMAGCFSKHTAAHILQSNPCGFCGVWLAIARFLKSKRIRPLGWPRPKEAVPGCCQLSSCSFQGMLMPNDAKRLVCRVFVCFLFSPGKRWFWVKPHQSHGFGSPKALEVPADNFKHLCIFLLT